MNNSHFQVLKIIAGIGVLSFTVSDLSHATSVTPATVSITNTCDSSENIQCIATDTISEKGPCGDHSTWDGEATLIYFETPSPIPKKTGKAQLTLGKDSSCYNYHCKLTTLFDRTSSKIESGKNYNCTLKPNDNGIHTCDISCVSE